MSKDQKRRMSGRTALKLAAAAAIFLAGLMVGGGISDGGDQECAPAAVGSAR